MTQIDRLATIRHQLRELQNEAGTIRQEILAGHVPLEGDTHVASVRRHIRLKRIADAPVQPKANGAMKRPVPMQPMPHPMWQNREVE